MGIVRNVLQQGIGFVREEILPLRGDLMKAGILKPDAQAYDPKTSLVDPLSYQSTGYGYKERYSLLDYQKCRQITYADPIVAAVIQTRVNQVASFAQAQTDKYKVGFKIKLRDIDKEPTDAELKEAKEIQQFVLACGVPEDFEDTPDIKRRDNFDTFLRKVARDSLTFDQVNFEVTPRNNGLPYRFQAADAGTIRLIADKKENAERTGAPYVDPPLINPFDSEKIFREYDAKSPRTAQVINGVVRHTFDEWEMAFGVRNPRSDIMAQGYGFSEIEMLVTTITSHMNAESYNRKFFSQGSSIKGVLAFEGSVPPDQLEAFRRQWYSQVTGINNAWRTPIMSLGKDSKMNWVSLHSSNREMEFGKWMEYCIKTICGVFQMDPIEIGFDISKIGAGAGGGGGGLGMQNQSERITFSQDKGLRPLLRHIQQLLNDYVVYRLNPDFEFEFVGLNVGDEMGDIEKTEKQIKTFKTVNEIRAEHDLKEIDLDEIAENPGNIILDPQFIQFVTAQLQAKQQADAAAQGQQMGPDGQPLPQPGEEVPEDEPDPNDQGGDEEPDYENMSVEELQSELDKLESQSADAGSSASTDQKEPAEGEDPTEAAAPGGGKGGPPAPKVPGVAKPGQAGKAARTSKVGPETAPPKTKPPVPAKGAPPAKPAKAAKRPLPDEPAIKSMDHEQETMTAFLELEL